MAETIDMRVSGMTCDGCAKGVKTAIEALPGVERADVTLDGGKVSVRFDGGRVQPGAMKTAVEDAGFDVVS